MTAQFSEVLESDHPSVDFGGLHLYGVIRGPIHLNRERDNPHENSVMPKPRWPTCTANLRGSS